MRLDFCALVLLLTSSIGFADEIARNDFINRLNDELEADGVTVESFERSEPFWDSSSEYQMKAPILDISVPEYGVAAVDGNGEIIQVFGPSVSTIKASDGSIKGVMGFIADAGTKFSVIGADKYTAIVTQASSELGLDGGFKRAVRTMRNATNYIAAEFCSSPARPSEITMSLSADFKLVFGASGGTTAKWEIDKTCTRFGEN
ncbi:hypothetical protein [Sedimentitalea todarodis]|uniref:Uncharacterized protein n=1 Tax=Sedimentitalea todarodis TaxID=1631240 RepID=A0ABU3VKX1_9RHOB|nr:hypothetical protein [Sedimentitalea todarodis]MDU9006842.1 hypothetical protein [Sedimentitalea todarodis]